MMWGMCTNEQYTIALEFHGFCLRTIEDWAIEILKLECSFHSFLFCYVFLVFHSFFLRVLKHLFTPLFVDIHFLIFKAVHIVGQCYILFIKIYLGNFINSHQTMHDMLRYISENIWCISRFYRTYNWEKKEIKNSSNNNKK